VSPVDQGHIRNFCIIAHIDHGKSTLADRILQMTGAVSERDMRSQVLDSMDLERERGITIKAQAVRVHYTASDGETYQLNLIDTPGHVDFSYEVSRSLAACEGALLVVDASQGIEAQTLANTYLAIEGDLEVIPVLNKIDLPAADPELHGRAVADLIGDDPENVLRISAKTGEGIEAVLEAVVARVPAPHGDLGAPARALIFDSVYDQYRGVVAFVRVMDGVFEKGDRLRCMQTGLVVESEEIGVMSPVMTPTGKLSAGETGYLVTGLGDAVAEPVGGELPAERDAVAASPEHLFEAAIGQIRRGESRRRQIGDADPADRPILPRQLLPGIDELAQRRLAAPRLAGVHELHETGAPQRVDDRRR